MDATRCPRLLKLSGILSRYIPRAKSSSLWKRITRHKERNEEDLHIHSGLDGTDGVLSAPGQDS
jgi:hypothetical protein